MRALLIAAVIATLAACAPADEGPGASIANVASDGDADGTPDETGAERADDEIDPSDATQGGVAALKTEDGLIHVAYRWVNGVAITQGDIVLPIDKTQVHSTISAIAIKRWPSARVPYEVSGDLPEPERVTDAIAHWEAKTSLRFVKRTTEADYVLFRSGSGCSATIGKKGGLQHVNLSTSESGKSVVGIAIDRSNDRVYYYYRRGFATVGSTSRALSYKAHFAYALPAGKTPADIVEIAVGEGGVVQTWYADGTLSQGTFQDLGATASNLPVTLPAGKQPADIAAVGIDAQGHAHAYFEDGTFSVGTSTDLAAHAAPAPFTVASSKTAAQLDHVDVTKDGSFFAVYDDGRASVGTAAALAATKDVYRVSFPGHCGTGSTIHEIGHTVGLFHEQTRHDRDDYVTIEWANIQAGHEHNFEKYVVAKGQDVGAYDFDSVMHYGSKAFSSNGQPTILKKDGSTITANRTGLSAGDLAGLAQMYP